MRDSRGTRLPFRRLHWPQEVTTFSQVVRPPRERGTKWSKVSSWVGLRVPQYWQVKWSRRKTLKRVKASRRAARMYSLSAITLGSRIAMVGECTNSSYSETMFTRSRKTALMVSCQDHSESGK